MPPPSSPRGRRGVGVAIDGWIGGLEPSSAVCRMDPDGGLSVIVGSVDMSGTNTGFAQIAAETFGLGVDRARVVNAETESAAYAGASGGRSTRRTGGSGGRRPAPGRARPAS